MNIQKKFKKGFKKTESEQRIEELKTIIKNKSALIRIFQERHQSLVIETDPFTHKPSPTNAQIEHAYSKIPDTIKELQLEITNLKNEEKIRWILERISDGVKQIFLN